MLIEFIELQQNVKDNFDNGKLPLLLYSIGFYDHQPHMVRPEGFNCHHFIWVTKGEGVFTFGDKTITLKKGQGVYFGPNFPHEYKAGKSGVFGSAWMTFYGLDELLKNYGITDSFVFNTTDELSQATHILHKHSTGNSTVMSRSVKLYSLVTDFLSSHFAPGTPLSEKVELFLENNFSNDISLDDIANAVLLNKYTLCKNFLEASGTTVMGKLKSIRIAKAKQYLSNTALSAEEIGKMCGFQSPSYFGKVFREITGKTPCQYRKAK